MRCVLNIDDRADVFDEVFFRCYVFFSFVVVNQEKGKKASKVSRIFIPSKLTDYVSLFCVVVEVGEFLLNE